MKVKTFDEPDEWWDMIGRCSTYTNIKSLDSLVIVNLWNNGLSSGNSLQCGTTEALEPSGSENDLDSEAVCCFI